MVQPQRLNRCRIFLQAETLSDITDGTGDQISRRCYMGLRNTFKSSTHDWPEQGNPDKITTLLSKPLSQAQWLAITPRSMNHRLPTNAESAILSKQE